MESKKFVSDIIDINVLKPGDYVFINTQTGTGKTTFIVNVLFEYARTRGKKVLHLSNRCALSMQLRSELFAGSDIPMDKVDDIVNIGGIVMASYQVIESVISTGYRSYGSIDINDFDFIVCDEAHYFISDAAFNPLNGILFDYITRYCPKAIKLFISATLEDVREAILDHCNIDPSAETAISRQVSDYLTIREAPKHRSGFFPNVRILDYHLDPDYRYVSPCLIKDASDLLDFIINTPADEKWLVFLDDKTKGQDLKNNLEEKGIPCAFTCSNGKESEKQPLDEIAKNEFFSPRVLITTRILDNGVTIKDHKLKHVFIGATDRTEFLQMLGRKRVLDSQDTLTLYMIRSNRKVFSDQYRLSIKPAMKLIKAVDSGNTDSILEYLSKNEIDHIKSGLLYKGVNGMRINRTARYCLHFWKRHVLQILHYFNDDPVNAFLKQQLCWIGKTMKDIKELEAPYVQQERDKLSDYLHDIYQSGKKLSKDEYHALRDQVKCSSRIIGDPRITCRKDKIRPINLRLCNELLQDFGYQIRYTRSGYELNTIESEVEA